MSARHTPATSASNKRPCRNSRTSALWAGKTPINPCLHGYRSPSPHRGTAPPTNLIGAEGRRTAPLRTPAGARERTPPPPPVSNPYTTPHLPEATELFGAGSGGCGGVRVGVRATAAARCAQSAPMRASPLITPLHVPSHHVLQVRPTRTHPAPLPQLKSTDRRQQKQQDERKVPISIDRFRLDQQEHGC